MRLFFLSSIGMALAVATISMIVSLPAHADADELQLSVQHINAADYSQQPDAGAISTWMVLKYLANGSDSHISTPGGSAIANIYDYGRSLQPAGAFDQNTLQEIMNHFEIDPDYDYKLIYGTGFVDLLNKIAFWMNRDIPNVEPYPINAPAMIPFSGTYEHWVVVTGTLADEDPYHNPNTIIRGLWIDDPAIYDDPFMPVETNIFYSTEAGVMNNLDDFYLPMASGNMAGNFVAVVPFAALEYDYGDSPDPDYPTLLASSGAQHVIVPGFFLGAAVDGELDGQSSPLADGDDSNGFPDDEDGVTFTSLLIQGYTADIDVVASMPGVLNAWLDFNFDGDWADVNEQIFTDEPLDAGVNNLTFMVPATAPLGMTFARFRLNSSGGLSYEGLANDGEVEDYMVEVFDETVPTMLQSYGADWVNGCVEVSWSLSSAHPDFQFSILRREGSGNLLLLTGAVMHQDGMQFAFRDFSAEAGHEYFYRVILDTGTGSSVLFETMVTTPALKFTLHPVYPNPFNPSTIISYNLDRVTSVNLQILDVQGRFIRTLVSESQPSGTYSTVWNGRDDSGHQVASGLYFIVLKTSTATASQKMLLLK